MSSIADREKYAFQESKVIMSMMNELGIHDFDDQTLAKLLEYNYKYCSLILEDARKYSNYSDKKSIDEDDVKLAIHFLQDKVLIKPPERQVLKTTALEINSQPLPSIKHINGLRIPQNVSNFSRTNYMLKTDLCEKNKQKKNTKTTAAQILEASKRQKTDHNNFQCLMPTTDQITSSFSDFDLQTTLESQPDGQESIEVDVVKDEIVENFLNYETSNDLFTF